jgi:hypothetical protein
MIVWERTNAAPSSILIQRLSLDIDPAPFNGMLAAQNYMDVGCLKRTDDSGHPVIPNRDACAVRGDKDFHKADKVLRDMLLQNLRERRLPTGVTDKDAKLGGPWHSVTS